ncbi:MAG: hypothetical protein ONB46_20745 [candidate division KSB1 bacterium]|nr:hypothetical protein [candidate division KSB1 bacterium]MDZ7368214.1 hypothetical protein [candidate division KSB1 bacterium]MDZ7403948.1 hypothetical protein [candidate division KSB1 bacterium]
MTTSSIPAKHARRLALLFVFLPIISQAQLISVKSVPVAAAEQFLLVPSQNLGMGGVSLALEDASADPFVNPAKGGRIHGVYLFSAPVFGTITENNGGVRTLPLGALLGSSRWFGGMSLAVQQLTPPERFNFVARLSFNNPALTLADKNSNNLYATGLLGKKFSTAGISLAAGISWAELQAMQGVDFLYGNSSRLEQSGHIVDCRLGLLREKGRQPSFEMLLLHNRVRMAHERYYQTWFWEGDIGANRRTVDFVRELDQTDTWGLHFGAMIPLKNAGSRAGLIFTANRKSHPKIPNYELMNIPRDPGTSWAFNFGAGLAHATDSSAVGIDFIFEPIWSHTWADAAAPVRNERGDVLIPAGGKTVENDFRFNNAVVRLGLNRQRQTLGFQLGLQARFIHYHLKQTNFVFNTRRSQKEFWAEWTPSIGFNLNLSPFQIRYTGRLTAGTGQPGVESPRFFGVSDSRAESNFIIAPSGSLTLEEAVVLTHQVSVVVKLQSVK